MSVPTDPDDLDFGATLKGLRPELRMFDRYTLSRQLGRGGMGVVWLGYDERLHREVALKFLPEMVQGDVVSLDELREETTRSLALTHPNIVRIHDLAEEAGIAAIVMEYVAGRTLSELRVPKPGKVFEVPEITTWIEQLCAALTYAHGRKIVHRDLKPSNLMIDGEGLLRVMDFGIAGSLTDSMSRLSAAAMPASGTLVYMSPQQAMGYPPSVADDVYSLGATLYELLTGKPPFYRGNIQHQIETVVPCSIAERREQLEVVGTDLIPETWEKTVAACLAKDSKERPSSAAEVWSRLNGAATATTYRPVPLSSPTSAPRRKSRHTADWKTVTAAALIAILAVGSGLWWVLKQGGGETSSTVTVTAVEAEPESPTSGEKVAPPELKPDKPPVTSEVSKTESLTPQATPAVPPTELEGSTLDEKLISAWQALRWRDEADAIAVSLAKTLFEEVTGHSDPDIAYQGEAGLAAIASIEAGSFQPPVELSPFRTVTVMGNETEILYDLCSPTGYIDRDGKVVIPPTWYDAGKFFGGTATVRVKSKEGGDDEMDTYKYGVIDSGGRSVIPLNYDNYTYFSEGLCLVKRKGGTFEGDVVWWGYLDRSGRIQIEGAWDECNSFSEGLAAVKQGDKWGYIDRNGKQALPFLWDYAGAFSEGLAYVGTGGKSGVIDRHGKYIIQPQFESTNRIQNGMVSVQKDERWGIIDRRGNVVIPFVMEDIFDISNELNPIRQGEKYGYADKSGTMVIPAAWDYAHPFNGSRYGSRTAFVKKDGKYGFIDTQGQVVIPIVWDYMMPYIGADGFTLFCEKISKSTLEDGSPAYMTRTLHVNNDGLVVWSSDNRGVGQPPARVTSPGAVEGQ